MNKLLKNRLSYNVGRRCKIFTVYKFTFDCIILETDDTHISIKDLVKQRERILSIDDIEGLEFYGEESI